MEVAAEIEVGVKKTEGIKVTYRLICVLFWLCVGLVGAAVADELPEETNEIRSPTVEQADEGQQASDKKWVPSQTMGEASGQFMALVKAGKYADAVSPAEELVMLVTQEFGESDVHTAAMLNNLGLLYCKMGKYSKAEPVLKRAMAIHERACGRDSDHLYGAIHADSLGRLYEVVGDYAKAEPLYERAMAIFKDAVGPTFPARIEAAKRHKQFTALHGLRLWTGSGGKFRCTAHFVDCKEGIVSLQKTDGATITIPLEELQADDQDYAVTAQDLNCSATDPNFDDCLAF